MKTPKSLFYHVPVKIFISLLLLLTPGCSDPTQNIPPSSLNSDLEDGDWIALLDELFYDAGIIVQKESSIQDAVNAARPGEIIYIEPGIYQETVTIDKPDIKLIGLQHGNGEKVVIGNPDRQKNNITITGKGDHTEIINIQNNDITEEDSSAASIHAKKGKARFKITRHEITSKIAHYQFEVRLGNRPFDVVRIHRVVRERKPFHPVRTSGAVFMLHGASLTFESIFLRPGTSDANAETSAAVYLADKNIDVWGMDFAWTLVPAETSDFSFMKDWGVERDMDHTLAAMSVARLIRGLTHQGFGRMNLLGFSYGVVVAYAAAGRETQQRPIMRDVRGIIAVDQVLKYAATDEINRIAACNAAVVTKEQINNGVYQSNNGQVFAGFAGLAATVPDDPSPFIPNLSNYQAALFIGTSTFALPNPAAPFWHFVGGEFNDSSIPVPSGLLYSDPSRWIGLLSSLPPYQPQLTTYEARACACNEEDVSIDDHLSEISVPILYLGAGGAFGMLGDFTSSLTASHDITNYTVSLQPADQRIIDFGHGDLFLANDAASLVWEVLHQWLVNHHAPGFL